MGPNEAGVRTACEWVWGALGGSLSYRHTASTHVCGGDSRRVPQPETCKRLAVLVVEKRAQVGRGPVRL
jgi:hypothetical protein